MEYRKFRVKVKSIDLDVLYDSLLLSKDISNRFRHDGIVFFHYRPLNAHFSVERVGDIGLLVTVDLPHVTDYVVTKIKRELRTLYIIKVLMDAARVVSVKPKLRASKPIIVKYDGKLVIELSRSSELKIAYDKPETLHAVLGSVDMSKIALHPIN